MIIFANTIAPISFPVKILMQIGIFIILLMLVFFATSIYVQISEMLFEVKASTAVILILFVGGIAGSIYASGVLFKLILSPWIEEVVVRDHYFTYGKKHFQINDVSGCTFVGNSITINFILPVNILTLHIEHETEAANILHAISSQCEHLKK